MKKQRPFEQAVILMLVMLLLCGCGAQAEPTPTPLPTGTAVPTATPVLNGLVDVGGYTLFIDCIGDGTPTVVLDSGLGNDRRTWSGVIAIIKDDPPTRVCRYDRRGVGVSDRLPAEPRTNQDMVDDVHSLLVNANINGPYVLVAHSVAGFTARLYASQYPEDVVGMVLVDSTLPDHAEWVLASLSPESSGEPYAVTNLRQSYEEWLSSPMSMLEHWDYQASAAQVRATGPLGSLPLVVLIQDVTDLEFQLAQYRRDLGDDFPAELIERLAQYWLLSQQELADLSSNGTLVIAKGSSHHVQVNRPAIVVDAILQVLDMIKSQ